MVHLVINLVHVRTRPFSLRHCNKHVTLRILHITYGTIHTNILHKHVFYTNISSLFPNGFTPCRQVGDESTIAISNARHPVLLMRGKQPVGNDMTLDSNMQALVLTGPNAGTVCSVVKSIKCLTLPYGALFPIDSSPG